MNQRRALAIACWFKVPYSTVMNMSADYAERLYDGIPLEHRPPEDQPDAQFFLNGQAVSADQLRMLLRGYLGGGVLS